MATPRKHLRNPPIQEAVFEFRASPGPQASLKALDELADTLRVQFPERTRLRLFQGSVETGARVSMHHEETDYGVLLNSSSPAAALRLGLDHLAYSKLLPYTSWEEVVAAALPLWQQYAVATAASEATRIGVRFINKLEVPATKFRDYLAAPPLLPAPAPEESSGFLSRIVVTDLVRSAGAIVTQASGPAPPAGRFQLLLDIDAFREGAWAPHEITESLLAPLRALKNEIFFACLTDAAVEPYE